MKGFLLVAGLEWQATGSSWRKFGDGSLILVLLITLSNITSWVYSENIF
jgi:hypothetical protein